MTLENHPNVFHFEGKLWVSEIPREKALAQLEQQRAWDSENAKLQRWWPAIIIGAVLGTAGILGLGILMGMAPGLYLTLLPIGFGAGAILGALVNKRFVSPEAQHPSMPPRPVTAKLTRIPSRVAQAAPEDATAHQLIEWSIKRFVPKDSA